MKILAIGLLLPFLTLQVEAAQSECWASNSKLSKKFKCCEKSKVKETNEYGEWGDENGTCAIKKKAYNIVPEFSNIPEFEISQPKLPDNYCWTLYANANDGNKYPCCKNSKAKMQAFEMDGFLGVENNSYCGIKGYHALWNDREKFVKTKNQWNNFKSKWDKNYKSNFERISVFVGEDESKLNFGWYSTSNSKPKIRFGSKKDLSDAKDFTGTNSYYKTLNGKKYYSNKVTVTGLKRKSTYYYRRNLNGKWEETIRFNTYDPNNFQFIFVGDPQIGGSHDRLSVADPYHVLTREEGTRNDAFNWNMTIYKSFEKTGKPSVLLSAGDQVDTECFSGTTEEDYSQEIQYSAFLLPDLLKTIPSATTVGNHEALNKNYRNHYNTPNSHIPLEPEIAPGYSYFFKYNNVLVVVLETNYSFCDDFKAVFKKAFLKYPNTDWRVAMFHHDIYGNGSFHSQDEYIINKLRPCLTELLSYYKFDLVINGHDHIFSASKFVSYKKGNKYSLSNIQKGKVNKNAKGTFYITANCSTGSKLFGFINQDFDYNYNFSQTYTSAFGVLDFQKSNGKVKLTVNYYEVDTLRQIDGPYIFEKPEKCWASSLGFPCCQSSKVVFRTDSNGSWSLENDEWCGIIEEDIPIDNSPIVSKVEVPKPDTVS
ncbi:Metallo-dependent phosphatase [Anaeromyces robustus]|uniref:Purple acid phosphatase n=1 Tax=Anaeromyces robustus TaxID=1754192 RepID=A0A1Y1XJT4_9FUNG|nr:Metallo-dependent phosphatase [Anaeromyces robustus]|eukprot:ORX86009.1 Metallo-dependent phosphatase [Anaeromyces robustus]